MKTLQAHTLDTWLMVNIMDKDRCIGFPGLYTLESLETILGMEKALTDTLMVKFILDSGKTTKSMERELQ
jgi:hypothetical protein